MCMCSTANYMLMLCVQYNGNLFVRTGVTKGSSSSSSHDLNSCLVLRMCHVNVLNIELKKLF